MAIDSPEPLARRARDVRLCQPRAVDQSQPGELSPIRTESCYPASWTLEVHWRTAWCAGFWLPSQPTGLWHPNRCAGSIWTTPPSSASGWFPGTFAHSWSCWSRRLAQRPWDLGTKRAIVMSPPIDSVPSTTWPGLHWTFDSFRLTVFVTIVTLYASALFAQSLFN